MRLKRPPKRAQSEAKPKEMHVVDHCSKPLNFDDSLLFFSPDMLDMLGQLSWAPILYVVFLVRQTSRLGISRVW